MVYPASFICAEPEILCNAADTYLKTLKDAESAVKVCFRVCQHPTSTLLLICIFYESQLEINPRLIIASHYFSPPFFFREEGGGGRLKTSSVPGIFSLPASLQVVIKSFSVFF